MEKKRLTLVKGKTLLGLISLLIACGLQDPSPTSRHSHRDPAIKIEEKSTEENETMTLEETSATSSLTLTQEETTNPSANETPETTTLAAFPLNEAVLETFDYHFNHIPKKALYFSVLDKETMYEPLISSHKQMRSASVIKLLILASLYQDIKAGKFKANTIPKLKALAKQMIVESDNDASNLLIDRLGGLETLNQKIRQLGFSSSSINRKFLDTHALENGRDNYVSAKDLGDFMRRLYQGGLISPLADKEMLAILEDKSHPTKTDYLALGLPREINYYNKTGQFPDYQVLNEAIIVEAEGITYILVVLTEGEDYYKTLEIFPDFSSAIYRLLTSR